MLHLTISTGIKKPNPSAIAKQKGQNILQDSEVTKLKCGGINEN